MDKPCGMCMSNPRTTCCDTAKKFDSEILALRAQRDELLEAVKHYQTCLDFPVGRPCKECKRISKGETSLRAQSGDALNAGSGTCDTKESSLLEALKTIPFWEYGDALNDGCDSNGAWDCFCKAVDDHIEKAILKCKNIKL